MNSTWLRKEWLLAIDAGILSPCCLALAIRSGLSAPPSCLMPSPSPRPRLPRPSSEAAQAQLRGGRQRVSPLQVLGRAPREHGTVGRQRQRVLRKHAQRHHLRLIERAETARRIHHRLVSRQRESEAAVAGEALSLFSVTVADCVPFSAPNRWLHFHRISEALGRRRAMSAVRRARPWWRRRRLRLCWAILARRARRTSVDLAVKALRLELVDAFLDELAHGAVRARLGLRCDGDAASAFC